MKNIKKPIFIIGVGRSGTSLLQSMLNSHSDVAFPPETHFIRKYLSNDHSLNDVKKYILQDENLLNLGVSLPNIIKNSKSLKDVYTSILFEYQSISGKSIVGDKDPKNIEFLKTIYSFFPQAIVIHIYRDPRAVISSRNLAKWSEGRPLWKNILAYRSQFLYGRGIGRSLFNSYIEVKYEDLVLNPEKELNILCDQIGISFENNMLDFFKNSDKVVQGKEIEWKKNIFKPVMTENIEKWKTNLKKGDIELIEFVLQREMSDLGYKKTNQGGSFNFLNKNIYKILLSALNLVYSIKLK